MDKNWRDMFCLRTWLEQVLQAEGVEIIGKGCGAGMADLDFKMDGEKFNVTIRRISP